MLLSPLHVPLMGQALLDTPLLNKDLAFTQAERNAFHLHGLLPAGELSLEQQVAQAYAFIMKHEDTLSRHVILRAIQDSNETVFYALLAQHLTELMPLVYTPGVGEACQNFSKIWRRPRGLFLASEQRGKIASLIANPAYDAIRLIIVTDGERILGLGDLGANGMGIPIGKLSLYTACAGLDPALMLPVTLDVGTDNETLRNDPNYIGARHPRLRGADYDAFVDECVQAIKDRWPDALLHWEDFAGRNAAPLLERYRHKVLSFNDDIQGTAAITTAAILAGLHSKNEHLSDQRIVIAGGGSAGCGIAEQLFQALLSGGSGEDKARQCFFLLDRHGLLTTDMPDLTTGQKRFARHDYKAGESGHDLAAIVKHVHPTILIGVSGQAGLFTEEIIRNMAEHCSRPVIFPLSNPTSHAEATPADILHWTEGKALVSTGSPFAPVSIHGQDISIDQTNNAYIFPGLGLGALACNATEISDKMLMKAAETVAAHSPLRQGGKNLLPPLESMQHIARAVARTVACQARAEKLCPEFDDITLTRHLKNLSWTPVYRPYIPHNQASQITVKA